MTAAHPDRSTGAVDIELFLTPRPVIDRGPTLRGPIPTLVSPATSILAVAVALVSSFGAMVWSPEVTGHHAAASETGERAERGDRRSLPLPVGASAHVGPWDVTTRGIRWSADDEVRRATAFPTAPPPGSQWALLDLSVANRSTVVASGSLIEVTLVIGDAEVPASDAARQVPAPTIPNELDVVDIGAGEIRRGSVGFLIPQDAEGPCALRIDLRVAAAAVPVDSAWISCDRRALDARTAL